MTDAGEPKPWIRAKVEALLKAEWLGTAGDWFRKTGEAVEKFNDEHIHIDEKIQQAPDIGWKTLQIKSSQTELNLAQAEEKKIAAELARRTLVAKTRQEEAAADTAETNALIAKIQLVKALVKLSNGLRDAGTIVKFSKDGSVTTYPAPQGYDYVALTNQVQKSLVTPTTDASSIVLEMMEQSDAPSEADETTL